MLCSLIGRHSHEHEAYVHRSSCNGAVMAARTAAAQTPVDPNSVIIDRSLFGSTEVHIKHSAMSHEVHLILATFFVNRLGNHSKRPDVRVSSSASSSKAKQEMNRRPTSQAEGPASELRKKGRASHPVSERRLGRQSWCPERAVVTSRLGTGAS